MATGEFTIEDAGAGNAGCKHDHGKRAAVLDGIQAFFTSVPNNTQTVIRQFRGVLATAPGRPVAEITVEDAETVSLYALGLRPSQRPAQAPQPQRLAGSTTQHT